MIRVAIPAALIALASPALAQTSSQEIPSNAAMPAPPAPVVTAMPAPATGRVVPASTMVMVTPLAEITSKKVEEGDQVAFALVNDIVEGGIVAVPRGTPVKGTITWKTGRAIGGKSGKFEVTFNSLSFGGRDYGLRGTHRQEGRGNTVGALLGSMFISGRSAVMVPGQMINVFTTEPISY